MIGIHDANALVAAFQKCVPARKKSVVNRLLRGAVDVIDDPAIETGVPGIKLELNLRILRMLARRRFENGAVRNARWAWLHPQIPRWGAKEIGALRQSVGLEDVELDEFRRRLLESCRELHCPELDRYIQTRVAELEFADGVNQRGFAETLPSFVSTLTLPLLSPPSETELAIESLGKAGRLILPNAAAAVRQVLDPKRERILGVDANLMLPVELKAATRCDQIRSRLPGDLPESNGAATAEWLWNGIQEVHRVLVVAAETAGSSYRGFWVPDTRARGMNVPGAPAAYRLHKAQAVIADDLPPVPFDEEVRARWCKYLLGEVPGGGGFSGAMFISLPVWVGTRRPGGEIAAIVNVNVHGDVWPRAYCEEWLELASREAAPWCELAYHAVFLQDAVRQRAPRELPKVDSPLLK